MFLLSKSERELWVDFKKLNEVKNLATLKCLINFMPLDFLRYLKDNCDFYTLIFLSPPIPNCLTFSGIYKLGLIIVLFILLIPHVFNSV